jgi:hypothetical protein
VNLGVSSGVETVKVESLSLQFNETEIRLLKPNCEIVIPIKFITSAGKNKSCLYLFLNDPQRIQDEEG